MRITGGLFCRQEIKVPKGGACRPTQDMVREALFSILAPRMGGARFLDLFAGSGAVGLEALSRGAGSVCWVDSDRRALSVIKENAERLGGRGKSVVGDAELRFMGGDALIFLQKGLENLKFDLIFADPPYDRDGRAAWLKKILEILARVDVLAPGGVFVMEQASEEALIESASWELIKDRKYGSTRLRFFTRKGCEVGATAG